MSRIEAEVILGDYFINEQTLDRELLRLVDFGEHTVSLQCIKISTGIQIEDKRDENVVCEFDKSILGELVLATPTDLKEFGIEVLLH